jgi:hypothetical protein
MYYFLVRANVCTDLPLWAARPCNKQTFQFMPPVWTIRSMTHVIAAQSDKLHVSSLDSSEGNYKTSRHFDLKADY